MFKYTMWMLVHMIQKVLSSVTLSNEIFCGSFLTKNYVVIIYYLCAYHISKTNFIPQLQEQKSGRRQTQCSNTLCEC